jgi:iron complex outermembrane receptor protein
MAPRNVFFLSILCLAITPPAACQLAAPADLADATLEELLNVTVTSVSKREQRLGKTAASVYVITAEDIRRSGLSLLPEILRLAPGVQVARSSSGSWAISIRGFNDDSANKLLVLVDGRSVYKELTAGVDWDTQTIPTGDIERIEVIRGPGAAMWGTNAVNGVINIITTSAETSQGGLVTAEGGSAPELGVRVRYGGQIGSNAYYRVGVQGSDAAAFTSTDGQKPPHGWTNLGANFRLDWDASPRDSILLSGNVFHSEVGHQYPTQPANNPFPALLDAPATSTGGSFLGRWEHRFSEQSDATGQISWERSTTADPLVSRGDDILTLDFQNHTTAGERQELTWGLNFRDALYTFPDPTVRPPPFLYSALRIPNVNDAVFAVFGEDQIALVQEKLEFIAAVQVSHNSFSGLEVQPTARLLWTPTTNLSSWLAVSRAVRTPSIYERSFDSIVTATPIEPPLFGLVHLTGDPNLRTETVVAYEAGQRLQIGPRFSLDASAFYNVYQHLASVTTGTPVFLPASGQLPPYLEIPTVFGNRRYGESYGGEASATFKASRRWKLASGYSMVLIHTRSYPGIFSDDSLRTAGGSPEHEFQVHSYLDLTSKIQLDSGVYFYGAMPALGVPRHLRADVRLGWRPSEKWEFSAGVQDALDPNHLEYISSRFSQLVEVPRNVYGKATWRF